MIHRDYQIVDSEIHVDMFDDRLEILSPGGMFSGSRIQDLDLRHVPSIRRNEIVSDLFGRLHYMDRRGSGIGRIMNSYVEFAEKSQFFSAEYSFLVILPNRSAAMLAQIDLLFEKTQLSTEKTQSSTEKPQLAADFDSRDQDWELSYFRDAILKEHGEGLRNKTLENLMQLFDRYRYTYWFNRRNIADICSISENGASLLLKKCLDRGIMKKDKVDVYYFVYQQGQED